MGDGGSSVWDRLSLEGNKSPQGSRHTYMLTDARRELTPLNLISFFNIPNSPNATSFCRKHAFVEVQALNTKLAAHMSLPDTLLVKRSTHEHEVT